MKLFKNFTLEEYLDVLSQRTPTPGGGSAAALVAATAVSLIGMVAQYSKGKSTSRSIERRIDGIIKQSDQIRKRLTELVDLDARAYEQVVAARKGDAKAKKAALRKARKIPQEVCKLSYKAIQLTPLLVVYGNRYLLSDVQVAVEFLMASFAAAKINIEVNQ